MSINRNRAKLNKVNCSRNYKLVFINYEYPKYWDDGFLMYPKFRRGYVNSGKQLYPSQMRAYKTWKYNRKTQWKE